ncbi:MAG: zf-TFIIB domain-containing protein [Gammaproteobacteria bacterium]|nr:zf-TFIIB domain-containing protein [Gammaproteobacteria bacterium]
MLCPKCSENMQLITYAGIDVERCDGCKGLWFDMVEHEHLAAIEGSEAIDTGSAEIGARFNKIDDIECPHCNSPMLRMVDARQPHIWYEACPTCYGVFFDAGEFRDYKEKTILDFFRDFFAKERP